MIKEGAVVVCPTPTSHAFLMKLLPSLISNIILHLICLYPGGRSYLLPLYASNAGRTFLFPIVWHPNIMCPHFLCLY